MSIDENKLEQACIQLRVKPLDSNEYDFLREYHYVMSLIATALNTLEANRYTFGIYLPTLLGLQYKLQLLIKHLSNKDSPIYTIKIIDDEGEVQEVGTNCLPLTYAIKRGFEKRFGDLIDPFHIKSIPLYVAMMSNPTYKLNFMCLPSISEELFDQLKGMLVNAAVIAYTDENKIQADDNDQFDNSGIVNVNPVEIEIQPTLQSGIYFCDLCCIMLLNTVCVNVSI